MPPLREATCRRLLRPVRQMHDAVRARAQRDVGAIEASLTSLRTSQNQGDYRGAARSQLTDALDQLAAHVEARKKNLV